MALRGLLNLPEREQSIGQRLAGAIGQGVAGGSKAFAERIGNQQAERAENEAIERETGQNFSGMTPDIKKEFVKLHTGAQAQKRQETERAKTEAVQTIQNMRKNLGHAGPSNWLQSLLPGETQRARGELATLGKSLIPLVAKGVPIRNQREFDAYAETITNPNSRQSELEGALDGLEFLLTQGHEKTEEKESIHRTLYDPSNKKHRAVFDKLMKQYNGNREKVKEKMDEKFKEE